MLDKYIQSQVWKSKYNKKVLTCPTVDTVSHV